MSRIYRPAERFFVRCGGSQNDHLRLGLGAMSPGSCVAATALADLLAVLPRPDGLAKV